MISAYLYFHFCWENSIVLINKHYNFQTRNNFELNNDLTYFSSVLETLVLVVTSHSFTVQSAEPDARSEPSQLTDENFRISATGLNYSILGLKYSKRKYILTPKGHLKASVQTHEVWAIKGVTHRPLDRSHIMIAPSSSPEAIYRPSGDIAKDKIILLWPMNIRTHSPVCTSHNRTVLSLEPVAM